MIVVVVVVVVVVVSRSAVVRGGRRSPARAGGEIRFRMAFRSSHANGEAYTQINIIYPTVICPTCSSRHPDGVIYCIECSTRLEPNR